MRERTGARASRKPVAAGAVLHTGPHAFRLDEAILAIPLDRLWR